MIRLLVVDDQRLVRDCIRAWLEQADGIAVVAEAGSGEEARAMVRMHRPDIVLMDLNMPGIGGLEATRRLRAAHPDVKIVGLSVFVDSPLPAKLLRLGAAGYVSKDARADDLIKAIQAVHKGEGFISEDVAAYIIRTDYRGNGTGRFELLTDREVQVLKLIADGRSIAEIAEILHLSNKTLHTHRRHLLEKLGVRNDVQLAKIARDHGLTL
jgi:two-component system invasion response regulator UvrY